MSQPYEFGSLPSGAASNIKPFNLHIPESALTRMKDLLNLSPVADAIYENSLPDSGRRLGLRRDWLVEAKRVWETEFIWRNTEDRINSSSNFRIPIDDELGTFDTHFVGLFSHRPDAIPIILLHGWPGSFLEFLPTLDLLKQKYTPETLPYHVVVPSLPGYTLSPMPLMNHDFTQMDAARIMDKLMQRLGFGKGYVAQGGDVGSRVARVLAVDHPSCKGNTQNRLTTDCPNILNGVYLAVHLNFCFMSRPASAKDDSTLSDVEQDGLKRMKAWQAQGTAYALEHATKPSSIGFALNSNPLAMLAWIGEKLMDWTDPNHQFSIPTILESISLYWLTASGHSSLWSYRHSFGSSARPHDDPKYHIKVPMGYSYYRYEIIPIPADWVATTGNLVFTEKHDKGGHFAAWEQPEVFTADLEAFVKQAWGLDTQ
ncbi:hypothetical protein H2200_004965 [Cladophialophora chaetospira]|uniref:Epoxide hydrolase N-terminal domain-containing protein n=1 Tax=Cladophialophora chaetospira TaxID=386627 RepID=A0AA38XB20_9EURO|nr:hypothetical protein H2200_004965 [Cladophialophora chaetospira]